MSESPIDGAITIIAHVPKGTTEHPSGTFKKVTVLKWHGMRNGEPVDASIPCMVEMHMADGAVLMVWADGTFVTYPHGFAGESYSRVITPDGVVDNPYRS